jgi:alkanesulfonate monooxygenase SsuD/methylene tetrahydromethanopterin reductase-like flavin-dependent oxidoreductase (luciferase family)
MAVAGTPEEVVPRLQELVDMGVQGFVLPFAQPEPIPYMEIFAREVMPKIRG